VLFGYDDCGGRDCEHDDGGQDGIDDILVITVDANA
jgi:hypothetical protein